MRTLRLAFVAVVLAFAVGGCTIGGSPMSTPSSARPPFQTTTPLPSPGSTEGTPTSSVPPARWAAILADLDGRRVPTDDVQLVSARTVTWNDGALGCPKPGQSYTQALVDGLQVVVSADGAQYDYRFGAGDKPKLCQGLR